MLVEISNLRIAFSTPSGWAEAVRGVSLTLGREKLGIVGESGSGKSLTARSLLRLLPGNARVQAEIERIKALHTKEAAAERAASMAAFQAQFLPRRSYMPKAA